jgi:eukaryotic-like serine/threonine-protein kinase
MHRLRPPGLDEHRATVHVLEHSDLAHALLGCARDSGVDHLIMGARNVIGVRRILGSVSARMVADTLCKVTAMHAPACEEPSDG